MANKVVLYEVAIIYSDTVLGCFGGRLSYNKAFEKAGILVRGQKKAVGALIWNEKTQVVLKRKWFVK